MSSSRLLRRLATVAAVSLALCVSGCATTSSTEDQGQSEAESGAGWGDYIAALADEVASPEQKAALKDGRISDQEYAYFQQQIVECLEGIGVTATWAQDNTLEYTKPPAVTNDQVQECNKDAGLEIIALRDAMTRNPQNLDESTILVECLKRVGAVDSSYTAEMLNAGTGLDEFINSDDFVQCNEDPLHFGK